MLLFTRRPSSNGLRVRLLRDVGSQAVRFVFWRNSRCSQGRDGHYDVSANSSFAEGSKDAMGRSGRFTSAFDARFVTSCGDTRISSLSAIWMKALSDVFLFVCTRPLPSFPHTGIS